MFSMSRTWKGEEGTNWDGIELLTEAENNIFITAVNTRSLMQSVF